MPQLTPRARREDGFTLVELLVAMLIMGLVGAVVTASLVRGFETQQQVEARLDTHAELQRASARMSQQLRGACPVESLGPWDASVVVFRDGDRLRYTYAHPTGSDAVTVDQDRWDAGTSAWVDVQAGTVVDGLDNRTGTAVPVFRWLDADGVATTVPSEVNSILLSLRRTAGDDTVLIEHEVHVRNRGVPCPTA